MEAHIEHWKQAVAKDALLQAEIRKRLQKDISAEFDSLKNKIQNIDDELIQSGSKSIGASLHEKSVQFTNTEIVFCFRIGDDPKAKSSSIQVTQGKRGPIEYFGVRAKSGEITWQSASGTVVFETDQLLAMLI